MARTNKQNSNSVRIIAGDYRSRKLEFPSLEGLRPTPDRVRETLFNWLQDSIQGETCLDLFAGSGALGFEAISRGASQVDFVEQNTSAANSIRGNIAQLGARQGKVFCADALEWLEDHARGAKRYGLVFLDPPFQGELLARAIVKLENSQLLKPDGLVYIEKEKQSVTDWLPENWKEVKYKRAGMVQFGLYSLVTKD